MTFAPKHVFVPVDADVTADKELAFALVDAATDLASVLDARVKLAHVALPVTVPALQPPVDNFGGAYRAMVDVLEARNATAQKNLDELKERVTRRGRPCAALLITKPGNIPELLVETAHDNHADVLVLATHARRGLKRVVLGSIAERTAHLAGMPVLLMPPPPPRA